MKSYKDLKYTPKNGYKSQINISEIFEFSNGYKDFLTYAKTERKSIDLATRIAKKAGFVDINEKSELKPGDKIYSVHHNKDMVLAVIGTEPLDQGFLMIASHIDAPRLDLKPLPLYEDNGTALLKTHYYGGVKKYQWTAIPLSLHATVMRADGSSCDFVIGEQSDDPVFTITDLLPHLAVKQSEQKLRDGITGENLNVLIGGIPVSDEDEKEAVKANVMVLLNEKFGMVEEDFISAEIEVVPAFSARDVGIDRAFVGGYGQDDRICAYTSLMAIIDASTPKRTALCILVDKEEIGSNGISGIKGDFLENAALNMLSRSGTGDSFARLNSAFAHSVCLSADVSACVDPTYPEVHDKLNAPYMSKGVVMMKYTGSRGKSDASDASCELVGMIRNIFNQAGVVWQTGELGKVDEGGGGTVSKYIAERNIPTLDVGPGLFSMHSPFEIASKADIYMAYMGYKSFYNHG